MPTRETYRHIDGESDPHRITASIGRIEDRKIDLSEKKFRAISGTFDLFHNGEIQATVGVLGYMTPEASRQDCHPLFAVISGGPSTPTSLYNAQMFSGTHNYNFEQKGVWPSLLTDYSQNLIFLSSGDSWNIDVPNVATAKTLNLNDPHWANGVQRNGEIIASVIECILSEFYPQGKKPPLIPVGSSYNGGNGMGALVIDLLKRGIKPDALAIISGAYDKSFKNFNYTATGDLNQIQPFINALPVMAVTNYFHRGLLASDSFRDGMPTEYMLPEQLYDEVARFAGSTYAHAATDNPRNPPREVLDKLADYLGLPAEVIFEKKLRIDPAFFCKNLLPGKLISALDTRYTVNLPYRTRIDPFIDDTEAKLIYAIGSNQDVDRGISSDYRDAVRRGKFVPIIKAEPWDYSGLWADGSAYKSMQIILQECPKLSIVEIRGMFDLNTVDSSFWDNMKKKGHVGRVDHHYEDTVRSQDTYIPGVDSYLLRMGHMLSERRSRDQVINLLSNLSNSVRLHTIER